MDTNVEAVKSRSSFVWKRHTDDWYKEPEWCSSRLFDALFFFGAVHDPACGTGSIVKAAREHGHRATGADIVDRGAGFPVQDFLTSSIEKFDNIVCNPPFGLLREFTERALRLARNTVCILAPVARLNAARWLQSSGHLCQILLLTPRPSMPPGEVVLGGGKVGGGKADYCWLEFDKGYQGEPFVNWLHRDHGGAQFIK